MELKPLFRDIADAIREKDGTADGIRAADFPERIREIPAGGVTVERLELKSPPGKTEYKPGETFDPAGMSVWVEFSNGYGMYVDHSDLSFSPAGPLALGTDDVTVSFCWGDQVVSAKQEIAACNIYGVSWGGTSTTKLTRTDDAADFADPSPAVGVSGSGSSPFDGLLPWSGMRRVTDPAAGELVEIPKFWYKLTKRGETLDIQIADGHKAGFSISPAHMDRGDGKGVRDFVYIGRHHCAEGYKSVSGAKPLASITRDAARKGIRALGDGIYQLDFAMLFTIWLLYIVEFADWNSQGRIGWGCGTGVADGVQNMGYTDSMTYHTGTNTNNRNAYGMGTQYRWIEGLWDNVLDWLDGCVNNSEGLNIILNPERFTDAAAGPDMKLVGLPTNGNPSALSVSATGGFPMFYPTASDGSNVTYIPDTWEFAADRPCLYYGGSFCRNAHFGLFSVGYFGVTGIDISLGCRLQKLP